MEQNTIRPQDFAELCLLSERLTAILGKIASPLPVDPDFAARVLELAASQQVLPTAALYRQFPGQRNQVIAVLQGAGYVRHRRTQGIFWIKPAETTQST